jgi:FtsP/CotA-like multicopper oxidase with cupredoxin domain
VEPTTSAATPVEPGEHDAPPRRRRRWILGVALVALTALVLGLGALAYVWWRAPISTVGDLDFANRLRIPPLAEREVGADGTVRFALDLAPGRTEFLAGTRTPTWGFDGTYLSPTLRATRGERVAVDVTNATGETTTVHWHGMHLPATSDGGPHQTIAPGSTWSPSWTVDQPAATLWFHPHLHGRTAEHVYRGASGMFIVDDPDAAALPLPNTYGVDDVPVIVQDRAFDDDGRFEARKPLFSNVGILGDEILVNGTHDPHLRVTTEHVRLRVLNASNARVYNLQLDDESAFQLVGTDGGLLPAPVRLRELMLSPGERAELVVAMAPGERRVLRSVEPDLGLDLFNERFSGGADSFDLLELRAAPRLAPSPEVPDSLVAFDPPAQVDAVRTRRFELGDDTINGSTMRLDRIDEVVELGSTEVWEIVNQHAQPHNFHPHLVQFAVLRVDGKRPPPALRGWKDTVYVPPDTTVRVIARFEDYADPDHPYMFHCHVLQHEDDGMMGQFVVVVPGAPVPRTLGDAPGGHAQHS